jgi:putative glutamine amidotransferase
MTDRPIVVIPARRLVTKSDDVLPPAYGYYDSYAEAVHRAGGVPLICCLIDDASYLDAVFDIADGFLFAGGEDVDPKNYGVMYHEALHDRSELRDLVEIQLAKRILNQPKPTVGICRGLQLFNVVAGGTLHPDIAKSSVGNVNHFKSFEDKDFSRSVHDIVIEEDSLLFGMIGKAIVGINSSHHACIDKVGAIFRATARSVDDDVVEAIEFSDPGRGFLVCVQWHPEMPYHEKSNHWSKIFEHLVDAASQ